MIFNYSEKINSLINDIVLINLNDLSTIKNKFETIVKIIFNEDSIVYIDKITDIRYILEVHFDDSNFYEIELNKEDGILRVIKKIQENLINERILDKQKQNEKINRNNVRFFKNNR